jgi:hypothetical protein
MTSDDKMTNIKVIDLDQNNNFIVDNFVNWDGARNFFS